jgi:hypothetical protein
VYLNVSGITTRDGSTHDVNDLIAALHGLPLASELGTSEELKMFRSEMVAAQFMQLYLNVGIKI